MHEPILPTTAVRLLLVDDHAYMREGLKELFALMEGVQVVAEAADRHEALERLREGGIDVAVVEMATCGEALVRLIRARYPGVSVIVHSLQDSPQFVVRAIRAGAAGYVTKGQRPQVLWEALRSVAAGGRFIDPLLARRKEGDHLQSVTGPAHDQLTGWELRTLVGLAGGARTADLAAAWCVDVRTVREHRVRLMEKMGFGSAADLVLYAVDHGLLD